MGFLLTVLSPAPVSQWQGFGGYAAKPRASGCQNSSPCYGETMCFGYGCVRDLYTNMHSLLQLGVFSWHTSSKTQEPHLDVTLKGRLCHRGLQHILQETLPFMSDTGLLVIALSGWTSIVGEERQEYNTEEGFIIPSKALFFYLFRSVWPVSTGFVWTALFWLS